MLLGLSYPPMDITTFFIEKQMLKQRFGKQRIIYQICEDCRRRGVEELIGCDDCETRKVNTDIFFTFGPRDTVYY